MKIGIDIQTTVGRPAGIGRYTAHLVRELPRLEGGECYRLFYFDFLRRGYPVPPAPPKVELAPVRLMPGSLYNRLSAAAGFPDISRLAGVCDLYHFPNFIIPPLRRGKAVVTVCDLSFARFPQYAEPKNLRRIERGFGATLERADAIVTISEFSKRELIELYRVPEARIAVTPLGSSLRAPSPPARPFPFPYFLFVGTIEPRKNLGTLLEAWHIARDRPALRDHRLVIAGGKGWNCPPAREQAEARGVGKETVVLEYFEDGALASLYASAEAVLFPSFYEGFGLPPLEAMACGAPVIASNAASIPEVTGDAAVLLDPLDAEGFARAMERVPADRAFRDSLAVKGLARAAGFTWRRTAEETLSVYRKLLQ